MKKIFNQPELDNTFDKKGYVTVKLLNEVQVNELKVIAQKLMLTSSGVGKNVEANYDLSFFRQGKEVKQLIFDELWDFFQQPVSKFLPDYEPLIINMFNKKPGTGEVPIHQNWTFVDEDKYTSVSVWIPLCDVSKKNGTLEVVPGTHKSISKYRSPSIPWVFRGLEQELKQHYMVPLELQIGQVGIIDDSLIHYSDDNHSDKDRPTIQLILKPKNAKAIHYLGNDANLNQVEVYEVDAPFFMSFDMNDRNINGIYLEKKTIVNPKLSQEKLDEVFSFAKD